MMMYARFACHFREERSKIACVLTRPTPGTEATLWRIDFSCVLCDHTCKRCILSCQLPMLEERVTVDLRAREHSEAQECQQR